MDHSNTDIVTTPESENTPLVEGIGSPGVHEFIRYAAASFIALVLDATLLTLLTNGFHVPYLVSGAVAFSCGLIVVYLLSISWVFEHRMLRHWSSEFVVFLLLGLISLLLNEVILWFFTSVLGFYYLLSKAVSVVVVFAWNFGARKYALFRNHVGIGVTRRPNPG